MPLATVSSPGVHGAQQQFVNAPVHAEWWQALHADKLNRLIDVARTNSPILIAAQATLRQARQSYAASSDSTELPQVSAKLGGQRISTKNSAAGLPEGERSYGLCNASVALSYDLDLAVCLVQAH